MLFVLLLGFASGTVALIYEIVWFQQLELVLGSSAVSLAVTLATFMGGTCLGSLLFPRVPTHNRPLRAYAAIELAIGVFGIATVYLIPLAAGPALAALCLLPPTLLMGATLPALSRSTQNPGALYAANIAGAVVGCLLTGFYLLRRFDAPTAIHLAAYLNLGIAAVAFAIPSRPVTPDVSAEDSSRSDAAILFTIALSGLTALAAEALWTRTLGLLLGASVYTLSIVLAVFLTGLGLGSGLASFLSRTLARPRLALAWCQLLLIPAIAWTSWNLSASMPYWPTNPSLSTDIAFNFQLDLARAFWALLPPTILWGASFPFALAAANRQFDSARVMSRIYAANTFGAILGALAATLLLIAWLGTQRSEQLLIAISALAAIVLLLPRPAYSLIAILATAAFIYTVPPVSKLLIAHGRYAATWIGKGEVVYAGEGRDSSVAVMQFPNGALTFHVAGKIQASNVPRDMRLQRMLGHLSTLVPAQPRSVLVIGCGAGITAGAVSIDPRVERVTIDEIEPLVPRTAATWFGRENFNVIHNPKVHLNLDDGRHFLFTTTEKFDAITVDPLDPWVKGAANLYTVEFYEAAKRHLNPGGVITMYIQLFETNNDAVRSALATFFSVFPGGTVWGNPYQGQGHDMVILGQNGPTRIDLDAIQQRIDASPIARSLAEVGMNSAVDLFETYAGRAEDLKPWLKNAPLNRDRNLRMEYLAGLGLNLDDSAAIYADMLKYRRIPTDLFTVQGR